MGTEEILNIAIEAIKINKLRSTLTALGVIIGVAAIILLISISSGLQKFISSQFGSLGTNSLFVIPGKFASGPQGGPPRTLNKITFAIAEKIEKSKGELITDVSPYIEISATTKYQNQTKITSLVGAESNYFQLTSINVERGRPFTASEDNRTKRVAVLGPTLANDLFPQQEPLEKELSISGQKFKVIGILKQLGNTGGIDIDNQVVIPLNTARKLTGTDQVNSILVRTTKAESVPQAKEQLDKILSRTLSEDDYTILSQEQLLTSILQILRVLTLALGGIAAISLVVGGVGISNIMLVSVTERTKEIGLRKALGARPADILKQFLAEAVILSLAGGLAGVALGYFGSILLSRFIQTYVPIWAIVLGLGFSTAVGVVFGVLPAIRASRLEPVEALRHE